MSLITDPRPPRSTDERSVLGAGGRHRRRGNTGLLVLIGALLLTSGVLLGLVIAISGSDPGQVRVQPPLSGASGPTDIAAAAASVAPAVVQLESEGGLGSGVIYDSEGLILTAAHVVDGATKVGVRLADGRLLDGVVVGAHEVTDIAVISIPVDGLPVALLGYGTAAEVGEIAIALGSPFGLNQTVTAGIISATGRNINGVPMVQTDAAINPGNSGGPLINTAGKVIGINDVIFTEGGGNDGIGFAVAIDVAIVVADQIVAGEDVRLASLGVGTIPDTSGAGGAIVREILTGSAADKAELRVGDRIIAIDGAPILDPSQLFAAVVSHRPGAAAEVEIVRDDRHITIGVTLEGITP